MELNEGGNGTEIGIIWLWDEEGMAMPHPVGMAIPNAMVIPKKE